jgi:predicted nucleotidyltransferase
MDGTILERLHLTAERIAAYCRKWEIVRLELFGSALRDDFDEQSDVDVLVTFSPNARVSLFKLSHMENELKTLTGREVDLVERRVVEDSPNWIRRKSILSSAQLVYAAA